MIELTTLVCMKCGGPLGAVTAVPAVVECEYCGAVIAVSRDAAALTREGTPDELRETKRREGSRAFFAALEASLKGGRAPYDALREASAVHLGTGGQTEAVARVTIALATDFERETGAKVLGDTMALVRIAEVYLRASDGLRTAAEWEVNLPFFAVTPSGPVHFQRRVTAALLAEMARRDPNAPPAPAPPPEAPPKKKRWWGG